MLGLGNSLSRGGVLSGLTNNYSLAFDGSDDYVENTAPSGLPSGNTFTISAWVNYSGTSGDWAIWRRDEATDNPILRLSGTTRKIELRKYGDESGTANTSLTADVWNHVVISINSLSATFYLNGSADGTHTFTGDFVHANEMRIGEYGGAYADGKIDEVAMWDVELDADAVSSIYNSGTPIALDADHGNYDNSGDLQGWWRFEEGSGTSATDSSANSNTGTLTNGPSYSTDVPS